MGFLRRCEIEVRSKLLLVENELIEVIGARRSQREEMQKVSRSKASIPVIGSKPDGGR